MEVASDENTGVRQAAVEAPGELGDPAALDALVEAASDEDTGVRQAAVEALGELGDPGALDALMEAAGRRGYGYAASRC